MEGEKGKAVKLHPDDNVVVALADLEPGARLEGVPEPLAERVRQGHKIASAPIERGSAVIRYGQIIGQATESILPGAHVHEHNLGMGEHDRSYVFGTDCRELPRIEPAAEFEGYPRGDGKVGTRNYLGVITSVNCAGSVAKFIARAAEESDWLPKMNNVDGVVPITHGTGCGMSAGHEGYKALFRTLSGYARHPNFAGILLVGLGCEVMQIPDLVGQGRMREDGNFQYMTIQGTGGTRATVERAVAILKGMAQKAQDQRREPAPLSSLTLALQCGGSDGYSGITANPALGHASDLLVRSGGTSILAETPEIYGAEHLLARRAVSEEVGERLVERIRWWEEYTARNGAEMDNNPSPGNKRGGLTTILEKSLGAVAKGGAAPLSGVYQFAEPVGAKGFVFMDSPGYDPCSVTGQIASGANLVAFTTGRGSVSGYKPAPCLKLATNTQMYERMPEDMDINCGDIASGEASVESKGEEIFRALVDVASGRRTKSELLGFGDAEFVPWQIGAVM